MSAKLFIKSLALEELQKSDINKLDSYSSWPFVNNKLVAIARERRRDFYNEAELILLEFEKKTNKIFCDFFRRELDDVILEILLNPENYIVENILVDIVEGLKKRISNNIKRYQNMPPLGYGTDSRNFNENRKTINDADSEIEDTTVYSVSKIVYPKKFERIRNLFNMLQKEKYIDECSDNTILKHFLFKNDSNYNVNVTEKSELYIKDMICWKKGLGSLAFMMKLLQTKEKMIVPSKHIHKLTCNHFVDESNQKINSHSLRKSLNQYSDNNSIQMVDEFEDLILNSLKSPQK